MGTPICIENILHNAPPNRDGTPIERKRIVVVIGPDRPGAPQSTHDITIEHQPLADYFVLRLPESMAEASRREGRRAVQAEIRHVLNVPRA